MQWVWILTRAFVGLLVTALLASVIVFAAPALISLTVFMSMVNGASFAAANAIWIVSLALCMLLVAFGLARLLDYRNSSTRAKDFVGVCAVAAVAYAITVIAFR